MSSKMHDTFVTIALRLLKKSILRIFATSSSLLYIVVETNRIETNYKTNRIYLSAPSPSHADSHSMSVNQI